MIPILIILFIIIISYIFIKSNYQNKSNWIIPTDAFPAEWRIILSQKVAFYNALSEEEKIRFENKVQEFLLNCRITGIDTTVDTTDKLLVASSAIIPIFGFKEWKYFNLYEVLLYPTLFNETFETAGEGRQIAGMVGTGYMGGKMILSKQALIHGFSNESDKKNTAIHEFVHLIDKADGITDGVPSVLLEKQYILPWIDLINKKMKEICDNNSDINPYGSTNQEELFAVVSEYFFEQPLLLEKKHPELYALLEKIFNQKMACKYTTKKKLSIGRNSPCVCGSGLKFKNCCGKVHFS